MHIGIHINNTFIAAAVTDRSGKVVLIEDESIESGKPFMNPLKIYIEDEFAYLGDKIDYLTANNYELNYAANFSDLLADVKTPVYKDDSGTDWNAAALIAVFLKKLKTDIRIYDDAPVKGAVVTVSNTSNPSLTEALKLAFRMADIPLDAVLPIEKAAMEGYRIVNTSNTVKNVLLCYLDRHALTISLNTLNEDNLIENIYRVSEKKFGEHCLYERFFMLLLKRYGQITGKKVRENKRNFMHITALVEELTAQMVNDDKLYIQLLCAVDDEVIELIVTRAQVNDIIEAYIQEITTFLKEKLLNNTLEPEAVDIVLCAGDARFFPGIEQQLKTIFHKKEQQLYNLEPEEVLTKGAALYAGATVKAADTSLSAEPEYQEDQKPRETGDSDNENLLDISRLSELVKTMNINTGCETI